jgi:hypothetical protein
MAFLYAALLLLAIIFLWGAYRILGTPSRLKPADYEVVLDDLFYSVRRAAERLKAANLEDSREVEEVSAEARKIFQTAYYQALRLRPSSGEDRQAKLRAELARTCQAYEWAARILEQEVTPNPMLRQAGFDLLEKADAELSRLAAELDAIRTKP